MTVHLVTAKAASDHVGSADAGSMYASVFGPGRYAVNQGSNFALTFNSANSISVGKGACFIDGRYVRVTASHTVTIDSGTQGMNRIDLIGIRYTYDSETGYETGTMEVVKGTPSADTPEYPTYTDGNIEEGATSAFMPLWAIPINGVSVGDPVKLFTVMQNTVSCPWPVGAILQLNATTDPNDIYPNTTWARWDGGMVVLSAGGSYDRDTEYGANSRAMTTSNMPVHNHTIGTNGSHTHSNGLSRSNTGTTTSNAYYVNGVLVSIAYGTTQQAGTSAGSHSHSCGNAGSGTAFNVMQKSKAVFIWERVA